MKARRRALLLALLASVVGFTTVPRGLLRVEDGPRVPVAPEVPSVAGLYAVHFRHARHERTFIASIGFLVAFALVRTITHLIRAGRGPFHDVVTKGGHAAWTPHPPTAGAPSAARRGS
jgi:hypothetical protein